MRALIAMLVVAGTACLKPSAFECATDRDCVYAGAQGTCEAVGRCSFPDPSCTSGRRFGELSGTYADQCVDGAGLDAGATDGGPSPLVDASPGADAPAADAGLDAPPADAPPADAPPADAPPVEPPVPDAPSACPLGYVALSGLSSTHRYRLMPTTAGWTNHVTGCANDGANVHLAIPGDAAELQALVAFATADAWVGISDVTDEGVFVDVHGSPATFLPWAPGEPDNIANQDCVRARSSSGTLETAACGAASIAICECAP